MPSRLILVVLVQIALAESIHADGTPFRLVVAAITVRAPLTAGVTCVPHEVMLPSILTQLLRIGIMAAGGTDILGVFWGAAGLFDGAAVANAPAKFRPIKAIAVRRIAAIIVFFILFISSF